MPSASPFRPAALASICLCGLAACASHSAASDPDAGEEVSAATVVSTLEKNFGVYRGFRRNHAKGVCAQGTFTADKAGAGLSRSPLFSGRPVPVVARFSVAGGHPDMPDTTRNPRGMALKFILPDGSAHMMAMLHTPVFGVSDPAAFLAGLQASAPDPETGKPNPALLQAFTAAHPETRALTDFLKTHNPPTSYASTPYYSLHAFRFVNAAERGRYVRWHFQPHDETSFLDDATLASISPDYLEQRLQERLQRGPAKWDMIVTLAEAGDALTDPASAWPGDRWEIRVGVLELSKEEPQATGACNQVNFDPMVVSDGVEPTDDPVLRFRSAAYAVSFGKRTSEQAGK